VNILSGFVAKRGISSDLLISIQKPSIVDIDEARSTYNITKRQGCPAKAGIRVMSTAIGQQVLVKLA